MDGLDILSVSFTVQEIDAMIAKLPRDKAPGPDSLNGLFFKRCWSIISRDFQTFCWDFQQKRISLQSANTSLITLVPEKNSPEGVNDFRPISLINSFLKLLTKLLADRLQNVILQTVHTNQYGFIKSRTIQDCIAWGLLSIYTNAITPRGK